MTSFYYFSLLDLSISEEKVEYQGKQFFFLVSSNRMKKKNNLLEISLD